MNTTRTGQWLVLMLLASQASMVSAQEVDIDVIALFKGRAVLEINGEQSLFREGDVVKGIRLIRADSREALIELGGEEIRLDLTSRIGTRYEAPQNASVTIQLNDVGQYRTRGSINNRPATFVVDTGANVVAMNMNDARALGIDLAGARAVDVTTAGGAVKSFEVFLDEVEVGGIRANNVQAAVLTGSFPQEILLGMTFLSNVQITESAGVLVLTSEL